MAGQSQDKRYFDPILRPRLRDGLRNYVFLEAIDRVPEGYSPVPFAGVVAEGLLRRLAGSSFSNLRVLRDMVYGHASTLAPQDFDDERVIRQVAAWLSQGRLLLVQPVLPRYAVVVKKEAPPPAPEEEQPPTSWIGIELVDQDGNPVVGQRFRLKLPDGTYREGASDKSGRAHISGIAEGTCTLELLSLD